MGPEAVLTLAGLVLVLALLTYTRRAPHVIFLGALPLLMVFGPGGYRFSDYLKIGLPLSGLVWLIAVCLMPVFWPF